MEFGYGSLFLPVLQIQVLFEDYRSGYALLVFSLFLYRSYTFKIYLPKNGFPHDFFMHVLFWLILLLHAHLLPYSPFLLCTLFIPSIPTSTLFQYLLQPFPFSMNPFWFPGLYSHLVPLTHTRVAVRSQESCMREDIWYLSIRAWIVWVKMLSSSSIQLPAQSRASYLFMAEQNSIV